MDRICLKMLYEIKVDLIYQKKVILNYVIFTFFLVSPLQQQFNKGVV